VTAADGGMQALELLKAARQQGRPFDLAILDMHMPHMDGMQLAQQIQSVPALAGLPMMMLSSTYAGHDQPARDALGIRRYLHKPIRRADLLRAITSVLAAGAAEVPAPRKVVTPMLGRLRGHVLLVEDNPINQGVATAMLSKIGLSWKVANDGAEAVARVRESGYDLVLMDCQMPVMDGFEATATIRALPDGRGAKLPIVALTANAMQGDEQACRDAGMDGFLAKPYTLAGLQTTLARWLPAADGTTPIAAAPATAAAPAATPAPPVTPGVGADAPAAARAAPRPQPEPADGSAAPRQGADPAINTAALATLREIDDDSGLVEQLVGRFLAAADGHLARVVEAAAAGDTQAVAQTAHSLKSSAANLGAEALAACCRELERSARQGHVDDVRARIEATRREQVRALAQLRELMAEVP
jgi:CheY-like chemotaxis protein/HPt (histidine-containing phosphotransfer) domain-containing protein